MKRGSVVIVVLLLAMAAQLQLSTQVEYMNSNQDICRLFPDNTKIREPGYCDRWIVCKNLKTTEGEICTGSTSKFNLNSGSCAKSLEKKDTYCDAPCTSKTNGYVGDSFNCANWYYCEKAKLLSSGVCEGGRYFDQASGGCYYPQNTQCNAKFEICQIAPVGVKVKDEVYCNSYITCSKTGEMTRNECEPGKYFEVLSGECIQKALVECDKHPLPEDACGNKKLAKRDTFVSDGATCRGYLYCRDMGSGIPDPDPVWQQCPLGTFFNATLQLCQDKSACKCSEDRCDGRESGFELMQVAGCHNYVECVNGVEMSPFRCDDDEYFDIETEKCTTEPRHYQICS
ncbi:peritrophin-44 [Drosophila grimshawi]|uniref:peritrophin-44 n=1 Tax=Drosophila grimshawi TaxID=7222 RepID=UPI000C86F999|nr:peritrophin-44 [Drosophila grimshawi]